MKSIERSIEEFNESVKINPDLENTISFSQPNHVFKNYDKYISRLHKIVNFSIKEKDESIHISVIRATEIFIQKFESHIKNKL